MPLSKVEQRYFYLLSLSSASDSNFALEQVSNAQSQRSARSVSLVYQGTNLETLSVFFKLNDYQDVVRLGEDYRLTVADEQARVNDLVEVRDYFYQEPLVQSVSSSVLETKTVAYLGQEFEYIDLGIRDGFQDIKLPLLVVETVHLESEIHLNDIDYTRRVYRARSLHIKPDSAQSSGYYQINSLAETRGAAGFLDSRTPSEPTSFILPGVEDGFIPCRDIHSPSAQADLQTIAYGLLLAVLKEDTSFVVSTLSCLCEIARKQNLIQSYLGTYQVVAETAPGLFESYSRLELTPSSNQKFTKSNAFLGISITEALYFLRNRPLEQRVELTGLTNNFESALSAVFESITQLLLSAVDPNTSYLSDQVDDGRYPSLQPSLQATLLSVIYFSRVLDFHYVQATHTQAVKVDWALRALPFLVTEKTYQIFSDFDQETENIIYAALYSHSTEQAARRETLETYLSSKVLDLTEPFTFLWSAVIQRLQTLDPFSLSTLAPLFQNDSEFDRLQFQQNPAYYLESRSQRFPIETEALISALSSPHTLLQTRGINLYSVEALSSIQYLKQWFASSLPNGKNWFDAEMGLDSQTGVGSLNQAFAEMSLPSTLRFLIFNSGSDLQRSQARALQNWSQGIFGSQPSFTGSQYWREWLGRYQILLANHTEQTETLLLLLGLQPIAEPTPSAYGLTSDSSFLLSPLVFMSNEQEELAPTYTFLSTGLTPLQYSAFPPDGFEREATLQSLDIQNVTLEQMEYITNHPSYIKLNSRQNLDSLELIWDREDVPRVQPGLTQRLGLDSTIPLDSTTLDQISNSDSYFIEPLQVCPTVRCRGTSGATAKLLQRVLPIGTRIHIECFSFSQG